jgi:hypothetical protein
VGVQRHHQDDEDGDHDDCARGLPGDGLIGQGEQAAVDARDGEREDDHTEPGDGDAGDVFEDEAEAPGDQRRDDTGEHPQIDAQDDLDGERSHAPSQGTPG